VLGLPPGLKVSCARWLAEARITLAGGRSRAQALRHAALRTFRRMRDQDSCDVYRIVDATADIQVSPPPLSRSMQFILTSICS
jgi:hypothetical protein